MRKVAQQISEETSLLTGGVINAITRGEVNRPYIFDTEPLMRIIQQYEQDFADFSKKPDLFKRLVVFRDIDSKIGIDLLSVLLVSGHLDKYDPKLITQLFLFSLSAVRGNSDHGYLIRAFEDDPKNMERHLKAVELRAKRYMPKLEGIITEIFTEDHPRVKNIKLLHELQNDLLKRKTLSSDPELAAAR